MRLNSSVVRKRIVTPPVRRTVSRADGERSVAVSMTTSRPPLSSAPQTSNVTASKAVFEAKATTSDSVKTT